MAVLGKVRRKSWQEKLADSKDLPKVVKITGKGAIHWGTGTMAIPAPREVEMIMRQVPKGKLITINEIRARVARQHRATIGCPLTCGIFAWISAHAAEEARQEGKRDITPWWRTLKSGGELNPKYPGGIEYQKRLLEAEGHRVIKKGKKWVVADYQSALVS